MPKNGVATVVVGVDIAGGRGEGGLAWLQVEIDKSCILEQANGHRSMAFGCVW